MQINGRSRISARNIGMIFQHYNLVYRLNVLENVLHGRLGYYPTWKSTLGMYSQKDIDKYSSSHGNAGTGDKAAMINAVIFPADEAAYPGLRGLCFRIQCSFAMNRLLLWTTVKQGDYGAFKGRYTNMGFLH